MTRRDVLRCLNEPFADPSFFGPEARSLRYRIDGRNSVADGFEDCTFASRVSLIEKEHAAEKVRLVDSTPHRIMEDLLVPDVLPPYV